MLRLLNKTQGFKMNIIDRIKTLGLKTKKLAELTGINAETLSRILNRKRKLTRSLARQLLAVCLCVEKGHLVELSREVSRLVANPDEGGSKPDQV